MRKSYTILFTVCAFFFVQKHKAQTHVWTGGGGNIDWFNVLNWDVNTVPDASSDVVISDGFEVRIGGTAAEVRSIQLNNNALFVLEGELELS